MNILICHRWQIVMRLAIPLVCLCCLQLSTICYAQAITLRVKNASLKTVIKQLRIQSDYAFFYKSDYLKQAKPVTLDLNEVPMAAALSKIFDQQPFEYVIKNKTILIKYQAESLQSDHGKNAGKQETVRGRVVDEEGALTGVSVLLKGTAKGTTSDAEGYFSIDAKVGDTLIFRNVGYQEKGVAVQTNASLQIFMEKVAKGLDEVVVVAYGTQKKATITGAIASIQTKEIKQSPAANLAVTLAGRLPGLTAIQQSGQPGNDGVALFLRGQGTLNGQNPIILVDGVERDINYIDPNEVENITILKDASSTAIFGVRGANGVVLVTTKRGVADKPQINFTSEYGIQQFTRVPNYVNAYDFATLRNQALINDGLEPKYTDDVLEHFRLQDDPERYPNNDFYAMNTYDWAPQKRFNLNLSGGNKVRYFVNAGFLDQDGQWKVDPNKYGDPNLDYDPAIFLKRYNFRSNIDADLTSSLKAALNVAGYLEKTNGPNASLLELLAFTSFPAVTPGPLTPDGQVIVPTADLGNPISTYGLINRSGYQQGTNSNVMASFSLEQDLKFITPGLSTRLMASFDTRSNYTLNAGRNYRRYYATVLYGEVGPDGKEPIRYDLINGSENQPLSISTATGFQSFANFQWFVNYNRTFGDHTVTGLLLAQQDQRIVNGDPLPYNLRGVSTRLTYAYRNRYFTEFNAGYNGSEQFKKGNRFGFFPSISAGWLISEEHFLKDNPVVDLLKVRGSYGAVGNDRLGGRRFLYLDDTQRGGGGYSGSLGGGNKINESFIGNPDLKWEIAKKANIGLELGLFHQLNLSIDVFNENRDNVLITRGTVPDINGLPIGALPPVNIGQVKNHGYEIELNYNKSFNPEFSILSKINFNYAKNKVVFADEAMRPTDYTYPYRVTGFPIGQPFGYINDGFFNTQEEIDQYASYNIGRAPRPGDFRYLDVNGDNIIDERDQSPIGFSNIPQYTFGAAFGVNYKGFDLSVLFQGVLNVSQYFDMYDQQGGNYFSQALESWTPERYAAGSPINFPALSTSATASQQVNTYFLFRKDFIRLKNAEIGYILPHGWSEKIGASKIRFYANGMNLFTWDKMDLKAFDPELGSRFNYPIYRIVNFGVNVIF